MKSSDKHVLVNHLETAGWSRHDLRALLCANRATLQALSKYFRYITGRHASEPVTGMTPIRECGLQSFTAETLAAAGFTVLGDLLVLTRSDLSNRKHPKMNNNFVKNLKVELRALDLTLSDPREQVAGRLARIFGDTVDAPISAVITMANLPFGGTRTSDATINWAKEYFEGKRILTVGDFVTRDTYKLFNPSRGSVLSEQSRLFGAYNAFVHVHRQIGPIDHEENSRVI